MAIARKRLTFDGRGRSIEYVAPKTITREIQDGTGRFEVVIVKHERIPFSEAVRLGLMDGTGKVTELGGSNLLDDAEAMIAIAAEATAKRAATVKTLVVPEHAAVKERERDAAEMRRLQREAKATAKPAEVETPSDESEAETEFPLAPHGGSVKEPAAPKGAKDKKK